MMCGLTSVGAFPFIYTIVRLRRKGLLNEKLSGLYKSNSVKGLFAWYEMPIAALGLVAVVLSSM